MKSRLHHAPRCDSKKCVRLLKAAMLNFPGDVVRVPNELAETLIAAGKAEYAPKKDFKAQRAKRERETS